MDKSEQCGIGPIGDGMSEYTKEGVCLPGRCLEGSNKQKQQFVK